MQRAAISANTDRLHIAESRTAHLPPNCTRRSRDATRLTHALHRLLRFELGAPAAVAENVLHRVGARRQFLPFLAERSEERVDLRLERLLGAAEANRAGPIVGGHLLPL